MNSTCTAPAQTIDLAAHFQASLRPVASGCVEWTGNLDSHGYGRLNIGQQTIKAHRLVWTLTYGEIAPNLCVMHLCDNPMCVKIEHLAVGTSAANVRDMCAKGRQAWGTRNSHAILNAEQVHEIRAAYVFGNGTRLARQYGVSFSTIYDIVRGRSWVNLPERAPLVSVAVSLNARWNVARPVVAGLALAA